MTMDFLSKLFDKLTCRKKLFYKILMFGLDGSGKTSVLYKLKICETINLMPTHGFTVENIEYKDVTLVVWDLGRRTLLMNVKELWRRYFSLPNNQFRALIFVVDSTDVDRFSEVCEELEGVLDETDEKIVLLVLANKQDLPKALSVEEVKKRLKLTRTNVIWHIEGICATSGHGLDEAMEWLYERLVS